MASWPRRRRRKAPTLPTTPWKITAKVKANYSAAQLDQIELSYGTEDRALKLVGTGDIRFGASPLLHAAMSARQLDADKFMARDSEDNDAPRRSRVLPAFRAALAALPRLPMPRRSISAPSRSCWGSSLAESLRRAAWRRRAVGDRPARSACARHRPGSPSTPRARRSAQPAISPACSTSNSSDPDVLVAWLQGRGDVAYRNQKPLRLHGNVSVAADRITIDALKAEINGGAVEGRVSLATLPSGGGSRLEAALKADNLDLDAAGRIRPFAAGRSGRRKHPFRSTSAARISAGQELKPLTRAAGYTPKDIILDRVKIGSSDNVMLEGGGNFDRVHATGKLALDATSASLVQLAGRSRHSRRRLASRLTAASYGCRGRCRPIWRSNSGSARMSERPRSRRRAAQLSISMRRSSRARHHRRDAADGVIGPRRSISMHFGRSEFESRSKFSAEHGRCLARAAGLDHAVAADGKACNSRDR